MLKITKKLSSKLPPSALVDNKVSLKNILHSRFPKWDEPRDPINLHAPDLIDGDNYCPREHAFLATKKAIKHDSFVGTSLRLTFEMGHSLEERMRNVWLRDLAVGDWLCSVCNHHHPKFEHYPKGKCPSCGYKDRWQYKETRFKSQVSGISGAIDLLVDVGEPKLRLVELKTMASDGFKKLVAPLAEHRWRTSLYLRLVAESGHPMSHRINTNSGIILYVSRGFGIADDSLAAHGIVDASFTPFKEFHIKRDDSCTDSIVPKAKAYTHWLTHSKGDMFPCGICTNQLSKRAQTCPALSVCFSGGAEGNITWVEGNEPRHQHAPIIIK